ncbi:MAG: class I SAM-dependent RNA methyltransferase, partial [Bacteroidota bacterium]
MSDNIRFVAKTITGLEEVLAKELQRLGARDVEQLYRAVAFTGDKGFL